MKGGSIESLRNNRIAKSANLGTKKLGAGSRTKYAIYNCVLLLT